jgi:hypothetical protein
MKQWQIRHYSLPNEQFALDEKLKQGWEPFAVTTVAGYQAEVWLRKTCMMIEIEIEFKWFDVKSFAKELGYSESYIRHLIATKIVKASKEKGSRNWMIPESELISFKRRR